MYCPNCGSQLAPGARFCSSCGIAVADPSMTQPSAPPAYGAPYGYAVPRQMPAIFGGDWAGAAIVNAIGLGAMFALSLIGAIAGGTGNAPQGSAVFSVVFHFVAMAAGGSVSFESGLGGDSVDVAFRPLTVALVGYGLLAFAFLRRLRRGGPLTRAGYGLQVGRVAVIHVGALAVIALLSRLGDAGPFVVDSSVDVASTMFYGAATLGIALFTVTVLGLPGLFPGRVEHYRGLIAGPVRAMLFLTVASSVVTFVLVLVLMADDPGGNRLGIAVPSTENVGDLVRQIITLVVLVLPNLAGYVLLFGMGVPLHVGVSLGDLGGEESRTILDAAGDDGLYWVMAGIALVLLVATGWYSARHSPVTATGKRVGWWLAAVMPVALFVLALGLDTSASAGGFGGGGGFDLFFVILLGAVYGIGVGMLGTVLVRRREPAPGHPMTRPGYGPPPLGYGPPPQDYGPPSQGYGPPTGFRPPPR